MPSNASPIQKRRDFPAAAFYSGLILFAVLTLVFWATDLDLRTAGAFYDAASGAWTGSHWAWSEALYHWGQAPADICGALGWTAFLLSFASKRLRSWRGPGLYLGLLLLAGPGLLANVLAKGLAGRPRPMETLGYGGIWEFHRPFQFGVPGRGASFLSGHAANAWYFLGLVFLVPRPAKTFTLGLALAFGAAMCLARVSQGAHWLSDTLLVGAAMWTLAAGLSPLIHWQPPAGFFSRGPVLFALGGILVAWLSISRVVYEERYFSIGSGLPVDLAPTHRELPAAPVQNPREVDVDLGLLCGDITVQFDPAPPDRSGTPDLPLTLEEIFQGQGLPTAGESLVAGPLAAGGEFAPGPKAYAVSFRQGLHGLWLSRRDQLTLGLPEALEVDARLRTVDGAINIEAFPAGRRVLLSGLPADSLPPDGFQPFGDKDWMRDGKPPLISLDLSAPVLRFEQDKENPPSQ